VFSVAFSLDVPAENRAPGRKNSRQGSERSSVAEKVFMVRSDQV